MVKLYLIEQLERRKHESMTESNTSGSEQNFGDDVFFIKMFEFQLKFQWKVLAGV